MRYISEYIYGLITIIEAVVSALPIVHRFVTKSLTISFVEHAAIVLLVYTCISTLTFTITKNIGEIWKNSSRKDHKY